eukprot:562206-Rhodomonas_salina.1
MVHARREWHSIAYTSTGQRIAGAKGTRLEDSTTLSLSLATWSMPSASLAWATRPACSCSTDIRASCTDSVSSAVCGGTSPCDVAHVQAKLVPRAEGSVQARQGRYKRGQYKSAKVSTRGVSTTACLRSVPLAAPRAGTEGTWIGLLEVQSAYLPKYSI